MGKPDQQHLALLEKLFDAKLAPMQDGQQEIKELLENISVIAHSAHSRLDKWENRAWGFSAALASVSAGLGIVANKLVVFLFH